VKKTPAPAILALTATNSFSALNGIGNNSTVQLSNGAGLIIGDGENQSSTLSSAITQTGAAVSGATHGAITKNGTGLLDLSGESKGTLTLVSGSDVVVNGGQLRIAANIFANANGIVLNNGSELQLVQGGGGAFANNVSGTGDLHLMSGTLQLTGTGNSYSGGTILEVGAVLDATTANLSSTNANITNAGGVLVLDQATSGSYTGIMSDGQAAGTGPTLSGSLVKDDSSGANGGNVTLTKQQNFTGSTSVEAGTLTLAAQDTLVKSSGVDLGRVGGGASATLALGADNTLQALSTEQNNQTALQLNGHTLTVASAIQNAAQLNLANTAGTIKADIVNNGTIQISNAAIAFAGTFTNNGGFISDPSTTSFVNLVNAKTGSLQAAAGAGFTITGNFINNATNGGASDLSGAGFAFKTGTGATPNAHIMALAGIDLGQSNEALIGDFLIGSLDVTGQSLTLQSGTSLGKAALYVDDLSGLVIDPTATAGGLALIDNITGDGFNIYYNPLDDLALGGLDYALTGGGELIADVPEPGSWLVIIPGLGAGLFMLRRRSQKSDHAAPIA
jgi:autotransporter-associated beta strand protein